MGGMALYDEDDDREPGPSLYTQFVLIFGVLGFVVTMAFIQQLKDKHWVFLLIPAVVAIFLLVGHVIRQAVTRNYD